MSRKPPVLAKANKMSRENQKSIAGGINPAGRRCCEWDESGKCDIWTCDRCQCP